MSAANAGGGSGGNRGQRRRRGPKPGDIWRAAPEAPEPDDIRVAVDPAAMLRSLGDPPLQAQRVTAGHYLAAVVEKAAGLASALAASADLLAGDDDGTAEPVARPAAASRPDPAAEPVAEPVTEAVTGPDAGGEPAGTGIAGDDAADV